MPSNSNVPFEVVCPDVYFRDWTIQDAKDGDVLVTADDERPFIYKGCLDPNHPYSPVAYCGIDTEGYFFTVGYKSNRWWTDEEVQPATKEQRDSLMKAIADAGFTFDFEKKELNKIEQKSSEQNVDNRKLFDIVIEELTKYRGSEVYKAPWALDSTGFQYPLYFAELGVKWQKEQKPAEWSEEDVEILKLIIARLHSHPNVSAEEYDKDYNWLKTLKDRFTWKPSDEQMKQLGWVAEQNKDNMIGKELMSLYKDLNKLKE